MMALYVFDNYAHCYRYHYCKLDIECSSCHCTYDSRKAAICKNCYKNVGKTEKKLEIQVAKNKIQMAKNEIQMAQNEDLRSIVSFFRSSSSEPPPFSDVVLIAADDPSGRRIPANRHVLACRSAVFRAMLETEMDESISGTIKIGEVSYDTLRAFVSFLYTAEVVLDEKLATDLLVLGEKYEVPYLKTCCEKYWKSILTWENCLQIYVFARQHNSDSLTKESLSVIFENMEELPQKQDYAQLVETDPNMVLQIYEAYNSSDY